MDDILKNWTRLSLTEDEGERVYLENDPVEDEKKFVLAARFLTCRVLNVGAIGKTFKPLWKARDGFKVRDVGNHTMLFVFEGESDAEWVLAMEPWTYDKHLILLKWYDGKCEAHTLHFSTVKFWLQIHGLPVNRLIFETAIELGKSVRVVSRSEHRDQVIGGDFL